MTISIPGMIMLPEIIWDASTGKVTKRKGPNAHLIKIKKSPSKKPSRKKAPSRLKSK